MDKNSFAIIEINDKQYTVRENDVLKVDRVSEPKMSVLMVSNDGDFISDTSNFGIELEILEDKKDKKITVSRFRNKSRYRKNKGFRQPISLVKVAKFGDGVKSKVTVAKSNKNIELGVVEAEISSSKKNATTKKKAAKPAKKVVKAKKSSK